MKTKQQDKSLTEKKNRLPLLKKMVSLMLIILLLAGTTAPGIAARDNAVFGGSGDDIARGIIELYDGGYLVYGSTTSTDGDFERCEGIGEGRVPWAMRLDQDLNVVWHYLMPDPDEEYIGVRDAVELDDGSIVLLCDTDVYEDSRIVFLYEDGSEDYAQDISLREAKLCADDYYIYICGLHTGDAADPSLLYTTKLYYWAEEESTFATPDINPIECTDVFVDDGYLYSFASCEVEDWDYTASVVVRTTTEEGNSTFTSSVWKWDKDSLLPVGIDTQSGTLAMVVQGTPGLTDARGITFGIYDLDVFEVTTFEDTAREPSVNLSSLIRNDEDRFFLLGYQGATDSDIVTEGDTAYAVSFQKDDKENKDSSRRFKSPGGMRYIDGILLEDTDTIMLLGVQTGETDKGIDVFIADWKYDNRTER